MKIMQGRVAGAATEQRTETFTGAVWADPVLPSTDGVVINDVFFPPGARTHWHTHDQGQILIVVSGAGKVCLRGEEPRAIRTGDTVWIAPDEDHWHGADAESSMLHRAISLGGHDWGDPVTDEEYAGGRA